ncbi:PQQ-dependent sugar dehydrogenase [Niabella ginsengisoli]|uniref:Sorbosone dehydrogenase family protein n=1 Tax=Niabella ginsengisoli TaxID=522298 RepID=A0ABS9SEN0_9BACT|nr:sorbosone dehydrogenase family protein [Niabella ginsengisoli]MCH5596803.1 sorbosone dehydrogenase family protein [Niabella ginsengisoli]
MLAAICINAYGQGKIDNETKKQLAGQAPVTVKTAVGPLVLQPPFKTESANKNSRTIDWPEGQTPKTPEGFTVTRFADKLENPRWTYIAPNGDYFIAEAGTRKSANQITLLRDKDKDGNIDERHVFINNLNRNFGMLILGNYFYIANTDGVYRYAYKEGDIKLEGEGKKIIELSASGYNNHWTRNIITNKAKNKIYITVGSASNVGEQGIEKEEGRALIYEANPDGSDLKIYASGIRNPVGLDWNPVTGELWTAVNERDGLGDEIVPDYATSVKRGGWYGWPFSYYGKVKDPRWAEDPHEDLVNKAIIPDVPLGPHTASLGITFYTAKQFPAKYKNGAFIGQHGSWNRSKLSGYKVVFIPFVKGKPQPPVDFLTGFIANDEKSEVYGRPVDVSVAPDGSLLVNDDTSGIIWKVSAK